MAFCCRISAEKKVRKWIKHYYFLDEQHFLNSKLVNWDSFLFGKDLLDSHAQVFYGQYHYQVFKSRYIVI